MPHTAPGTAKDFCVIANVILFVGLAVVGGLGSSWYMIEKGARMTTIRSGPWVAWKSAGRADADPYTRAHFLRRGMLPISSSLAVTYQAASDSEGKTLYSSCDYIIEGEEPKAAFWSLAVFDDAGHLIPNPAERYAFNSATIMRSANSQLDIRLSRSARPGNWLPTGGGGRISLVFTLEEPRAGTDEAHAPQLPAIRRLACR